MKRCFLLILKVFFTGLLPGQELLLDDGIYLEKPSLKDTTKHKYSRDNISYKINSAFIFDYYYLDKDGHKKKFLRSKNESSVVNPFNLINYDSKNDSVIDKIKINVDDYDIFSQFDSSYTQTTFTYAYVYKGSMSDSLCQYLRKRNPRVEFRCGDEGTGVVDNKKNLWMHPPRQYTFKIL
jgi:hypothetical protein